MEGIENHRPSGAFPFLFLLLSPFLLFLSWEDQRNKRSTCSGDTATVWKSCSTPDRLRFLFSPSLLPLLRTGAIKRAAMRVCGPESMASGPPGVPPPLFPFLSFPFFSQLRAGGTRATWRDCPEKTLENFAGNRQRAGTWPPVLPLPPLPLFFFQLVFRDAGAG